MDRPCRLALAGLQLGVLGPLLLELGQLALELLLAAGQVELHVLVDRLALADDLGLDGTALLEGCQNPAIKDKLKAATEGAAEAGLVGAPTFVVREGDEAGVMFWGQDRLLMVEKALDGWRPKSG